MIEKVINFGLILDGFWMDFGRILGGFWVTFGIIFRALYPIGFQERPKSDFGWILDPKTSKIECLNFASHVW